MRIGELARITGTSPRALRQYEEQGLLLPRRAGNGYREYDATAPVRVANIRYLLDSGLTLDDAAVFAPCLDGDLTAVSPSPAGLAVARERLARLAERIDTLSRAHERLTERLRTVTETG